MKKILGLLAGFTLCLPLVASAAVDACDQQFVHEGGGNYSDSRMVVNVHNSSTQIDATSTAGYAVIEVLLAVENDNHTGYWQYASGPVVNFNPTPGDDITAWKIRVVKVCIPVPPPPPVDVCPNIEGNQALVPEGKHLADGQCVDNVPPVSTSTPPESTPPPPVTSASPTVLGGGSNHPPGGHRHCVETTTGLYCPPGVKPPLGSASPMQLLLAALKQLTDLLGKL